MMVTSMILTVKDPALKLSSVVTTTGELWNYFIQDQKERAVLKIHQFILKWLYHSDDNDRKFDDNIIGDFDDGFIGDEDDEGDQGRTNKQRGQHRGHHGKGNNIIKC